MKIHFIELLPGTIFKIFHCPYMLDLANIAIMKSLLLAQNDTSLSISMLSIDWPTLTDQYHSHVMPDIASFLYHVGHVMIA